MTVKASKHDKIDKNRKDIWCYLSSTVVSCTVVYIMCLIHLVFSMFAHFNEEFHCITLCMWQIKSLTWILGWYSIRILLVYHSKRHGPQQQKFLLLQKCWHFNDHCNFSVMLTAHMLSYLLSVTSVPLARHSQRSSSPEYWPGFVSVSLHCTYTLITYTCLDFSVSSI